MVETWRREATWGRQSFPTSIRSPNFGSSQIISTLNTAINYMGGLVNVVTKSGTNQFHGDAFEFLRFPNLDSRNYFSPTRAALHRNQFGGTVGGPIVHNKIFFFADYQGTRQIAGQDSGVIPVLSGADRTGNLLDISNQLTGRVSGSFWVNMLQSAVNNPTPVFSGEPYYL